MRMNGGHETNNFLYNNGTNKDSDYTIHRIVILMKKMFEISHNNADLRITNVILIIMKINKMKLTLDFDIN